MVDPADFPRVVADAARLLRSHDVPLAKLERMRESEVERARRILEEFPLSRDELRALAAESPYLSGVIEDPERIA